MRLESYLKMSFIISWQTQSGTISGAEYDFFDGNSSYLGDDDAA
jgi:hypothetical protein